MLALSGESILFLYAVASILVAIGVFGLFRPWRFQTYAKPVFLTGFAILYFIGSIAIPTLSSHTFQRVTDDAMYGFLILILVLPVAIYHVWSRRDREKVSHLPRIEKMLTYMGVGFLLLAAFFFVITMIGDQVDKINRLGVSGLLRVPYLLLGLVTLIPIFYGLTSAMISGSDWHKMIFLNKERRRKIVWIYLGLMILLIGIIVLIREIKK